MGQIRDAALPGALVGLIHGIIYAMEFEYLLFPVMLPIIMSRITLQNPNAADMVPTFMNVLAPTIAVLIIAFSVLLGIILAIAFVSLKNSIPGKSIMRKALIFSIILLALQIITGLGSYTVVAFAGTALNLDIITIVEFPSLGLIFGYLFDKKIKAA